MSRAGLRWRKASRRFDPYGPDQSAVPRNAWREDRQIGVEYAHQGYEQLTNSPNRELKIFTPREGGVEHVGADNMCYGRDYIADWFAAAIRPKIFGENR